MSDTSNNLPEDPPVADPRPLKKSWTDFSEEAQKEINKDTSKRKIPIFNRMAPGNLREWLAGIRQYGKVKGWKLDESFIILAMIQMEFDTVNLIAHHLESTRGYDWSKFEKEMLNLFPSIRDSEIGAFEKLDMLKARYPKIGEEQLQKLTSFNMEFEYEADKLGKSLSNREKVNKFTECLDKNFWREMRKRLKEYSYVQKMEANPPIEAREQGWVKSVLDPFAFSEVRDMALAISNELIGDIYAPRGSDPVPYALGLKSESAAAVASPPIVYPKVEPSVVPLSSYRKEIADELTMKVMASLDAQNTRLNEFARAVTDISKKMPDLNQPHFYRNLQSMAFHQGSSAHGQNSGAPPASYTPAHSTAAGQAYRTPSDKSPCLICDEVGHFFRNCPQAEELTRKKWLVKNKVTNRLELPNGENLPLPDPARKMSRADVVRAMAREKGWEGAEKSTFFLDGDLVLDDTPPDNGSGATIEVLMQRIAALEVETRRHGGDQSKN
jgi:hypothetical protein